MTLFGTISYVVNMAVGLAAMWTGRRFGKLHHVLYAVVFAAAILSMVLEPAPTLWLTLGALAALPFARARSRWHPALASLGLVGYILALFPSLVPGGV